MTNLLVGYIRKTNNGDIKVSINVDAFSDCTKYETSDGQRYVALVMNTYAIQKVINGESAVSTIFQKVEEEE